VHGWERVNPSTKNGVPDENEFNAALQWRPKWSFLNGSRRDSPIAECIIIKDPKTVNTIIVDY
jgi:hypothetical protein